MAHSQMYFQCRTSHSILSATVAGYKWRGRKMIQMGRASLLKVFNEQSVKKTKKMYTGVTALIIKKMS